MSDFSLRKQNTQKGVTGVRLDLPSDTLFSFPVGTQQDPLISTKANESHDVQMSQHGALWPLSALITLADIFN